MTDERPLGRSVRRGLAWSLLNNAVVRLGTVLSGIVLARLLVPEDYGTFAVALVVLNALLSVNELGVSVAVVRWPRDPGPIVPTVATLSFAGSAVLYAGAFLTAPAVAAALGAPDAATLIRVLAASMLVDGLTAVPAALLTRAFQQGRRFGADLAGFVASTGCALGLAVAGAGPWSLVAGYLAGNVLTSTVIWTMAPGRTRFGWDPALVRELLAFGLPLAGSSLLVFGVLNLANVVVGASLGPVELGLYTLAFNLSSWPANVFSLAVRRVATAGFARLAADRVELARAFTRSLLWLSAATVPVCLVLALGAEPIIRLVYGSRWAAAAEALRWLAVLGAARVVAELAYDLLVAVAASRAVLAVQALWLAALLPALLVGARAGGLGGVALAQALVSCILVLPAFLVAIRRAGVPIPGRRPPGRHSRLPGRFRTEAARMGDAPMGAGCGRAGW